MKSVLSILIFVGLCVSNVWSLDPQYSLTRDSIQPKVSPVISNKFSVSQDTNTYIVWIAFTDKGIFTQADYQSKLLNIQSTLPRKVLSNRRKVKQENQLVDFLDIPVNPDYVDKIQQLGLKIRASSQWFNAVSVNVTQKQINQINEWKFVHSITPVGSHRRPIEPSPVPVSNKSMSPYSALTNAPLNYGSSSVQIYQINVNQLHNLGYHGEGVTIGVLDTGFQHGTHEALTSVHVILEYDFINQDSVTQNQGGDPSDQDQHGTSVLSLIGGQKAGQIYGPAYKADFILGKTEIVNAQDIMAEEDYWVQGLEWETANGAEVVTSSLGYYDFSDETITPSYALMNGTTYISSKATEVAYQQGVVICNAMGNGGLTSYPYMIAPADGIHVVSVGAVDNTGARVGFSSYGPSYDGRTKPDVMALGQSDYVALYNTSNGYGFGSGTSYATPLTAGVAALLRQIHTDWTPLDIIHALHNTASQHSTPDNFSGWGVVNASSASAYVPVSVSDWQEYR